MRSAKHKSLVTMNDVAAHAGVSQTTVSYVLNGRTMGVNIPGGTREQVLEAARTLGYQRNALARAMVTGKSRTLGVVISPGIYRREPATCILAGALEAASQNDYLFKILPLSENGVEDAVVARCVEWRLAGVMAVSIEEETQRRLHDAFCQKEIAFAVVDGAPMLHRGFHVLSDDEQGVRQVVSHLTALGHRRIAFLGGRPGSLSKWRERSFRAALADAGLSAPAHWIRHTTWSDPKVIEAEVRALFQESGDRFPTAIACSADTIAMIVLRVARSLGLRLPDDLSVTGYSNASLSGFVDPPLVTVDQSFQEMGHAAALQIIGLAESDDADGNLVSSETLLPTRLIERASTAPPPSE